MKRIWQGRRNNTAVVSNKALNDINSNFIISDMATTSLLSFYDNDRQYKERRNGKMFDQSF